MWLVLKINNMKAQTEKEIIIKSTNGIHAELASKIVQAASKYSVDVILYYKNKTIDLKSILGLMSLAVPYGENVRLVACGAKDETEQVIKEIEELVGDKK